MFLPVGKTPIAELTVRINGIRRRLSLKLESHNPCGSLKDRIAASLIDHVSDRVDPRIGIIESTSGNLGIAMATECRQRGVRFNAVVDPRASPLLIERMRETGADVAVVDEPDSSGGFLLNRIRHVQEQLRKRPGLVWTNQYESEANPNAHVVSTGPELREQVPGPTTVLVPVSTGGTLAGLTRFARISDAPWRFIGVDIFGSAALGRAPEERLLSGIGASRPSRFLDLTAVESLHVSSADAVLACLWLQNQAGIEVGGSSGATVAAAVQAFAADPGLTEVVCLCPDGADRYQTTIYRASWRAEHGIADALISGSVELLHVQ